MINRINSIFVFLFILVISNFAFAQNKQVDDWIKNLHSKGIALSYEELDLIRSDPNAIKNKRKNLANKYDQIRKEIHDKRDEYRKKFLDSNEDQIKILNTASLFLRASLEQLIIPLWIGGKWSLDGVPKDKPSFEKPVACRHFIQKVLSDVGLNIKKNGSTWLAYLSARDILLSIKNEKLENYAPCENFNNNFPQGGNHFYIIGL